MSRWSVNVTSVVWVLTVASNMQDEALSTAKEWMADPTICANSTTCVVAAIIFASEGQINDALRACHAGTTLEMYVLPLALLCKLSGQKVARERKFTLSVFSPCYALRIVPSCAHVQASYHGSTVFVA
jgi:Coatomer epsilon subunit